MMTRTIYKNIMLTTAALLSLSACNAYDRITTIGAEPKLSYVTSTLILRIFFSMFS